jgi:hypothetical protein
MKRWLFLVFAGFQLHAQGASVAAYYDTLQRPKYQEFHFLQNRTPPSVKVALIKAIGSLSDPVLLIQKAREIAQPLGANSFRIENFTRYEDQTCELSLMAYFSTDSILAANFENMPKNRIYVMGSPDIGAGKPQEFTVNDAKRILAPGEFSLIYLKPGQKAVLECNGTTTENAYSENAAARFYGLFPIKIQDHTWEVLGDDGPPPPKTGLFPVDPDLAQAVLKIYASAQ